MALYLPSVLPAPKLFKKQWPGKGTQQFSIADKVGVSAQI